MAAIWDVLEVVEAQFHIASASRMSVSPGSSGTVKKNSGWSVNANLSHAFKYDRTVSSKFRCQSKIIRSYTTTTEYVGWDLRAQKKFGRSLVYAEGADLLDRDITTTTMRVTKKSKD